MAGEETRSSKRSRFDQTEPESKRSSRFDRRSRSPGHRQSDSHRSRSPMEKDNGQATKRQGSDAASAAGISFLVQFLVNINNVYVKL